MRILLTNNHLDSYGGTEVWVRTMYKALEDLGHKVDVYTHLPKGRLYETLSDYDASATYDLALINHNTCLKDLADKPNVKKRVFTCHGIIPSLEMPQPGADVYVGVSEETAQRCRDKGFKATVIRNPVDTDLFYEQRPINDTLTNVLYLSTHGGEIARTVREACQGLHLAELGGVNKSGDVQDWINAADLVIGLGRGVYEALACRRNVIVFDYLGGDGYVNADTIGIYNKKNCSGRTSKAMFSARELRRLFTQYDPDQDLRAYIAEEHDAQVVARQYLML